MPFTLLYSLLPKIAERETRSITVLSPSSGGLPTGQYAFLEMFCDERGCDCRRVFFMVMREGQPGIQAVVAYGWESVDFYAKWMGSWRDRAVAEDLKGPILNPGSPTTPLSPAILRLARDLLLHDPDYVERLKRHYLLFREALVARHRPSPPTSGRHRRRRVGTQRVHGSGLPIRLRDRRFDARSI